MEIIAQLGSILGLSFISGINLYATVAVVGLCSKYQLVQGLPPEFHVLANDGVILVALFLYLLEFLMDKIPGLDTLWDSIHTFIRPLGGAMLALMQVGEASPALEVIVFMLGASLASVAHVTKAATRLMINVSPEPFSNMVMSVVEDVGAIGLSYMSLAYPKLSLVVTLSLLILIAIFLPLLIRSVRMFFGALFFKLKWWLQKDAALRPLRRLPMAIDQYFDTLKEGNEVETWVGSGYASKIPGVPRFTRVHLAITPQAVYCFYRRWMRINSQKLPMSEVIQHKNYSGRILSNWMLKTQNGQWLVNLYQPLSDTLPAALPAGKEVAMTGL